MKMLTITGIDETMNPYEIDPSPLLEHAFLMSFDNNKNGNQFRFPSLNYLRVVDGINLPNVAVHLCNIKNESLVNFENFDWVTAFGKVRDAIHCHRIQLNIAGKYSNITLDFVTHIQKIAETMSLDIIFQHGLNDRVNHESLLKSINLFPSLYLLQDGSGGRGIETVFQPPFDPDKLEGFAGGINPNNIFAKKIEGYSLTDNFWLDLESGVRAKDDWVHTGKYKSLLQMTRP